MSTFVTKERFIDHNTCKRFFAATANAGKWNLLKAIIGGLFGAMLFGNVAMATTCGSYTYTFSNGTTADAGQVNSNFTNILNCANTYLAPLASPSFTGNGTISGYWRVGSNSTPTNTTAGDLTAVRLSVGNGTLGSGSNADIAYFSGTMTETASTAQAGVNVTATFSPATDSATNFRTFSMSGTYNTASNFTRTGVNAPTAGWFENRITNSGTIAEAHGLTSFGLWVASSAASLGTVSSVSAGYFQPVQSFSNSLTSAITSAYGVHVVNSTNGGTGPLVITGQAGIDIEAMSGATNDTGLLLGTATIPTGNFGIYNASTNNNYFAGNVGVGTSSPAVTLAVVGDIRVGTSGTNGCVQNFAGTALTGTCSSDAALKTVRGNVVGILDKFAKLQLVKFYWNETAASAYHNSTTELNTGFIAQAVEQQFPELVSIDSKGYRQLDYSTLSLYGLEAIKELKAANDRLKTVNDSQTQKIAELKSRLGDEDRRLSRLEARMNVRAASDDNQAAQIAQLENQISELQRKTGLRSAMNGSPLQHARYSTNQQ